MASPSPLALHVEGEESAGKDGQQCPSSFSLSSSSSSSSPYLPPPQYYSSPEALDWLGRPCNKRKLGGPITSIFILGNQGLWNVSYLGVGVQLVLFFTRVLHQGNAEAANNVTNWFGTMWITTLLGGFLADSYLGRYWTCIVFQVIHIVGMILLSLSVTLKSLRPPDCIAIEAYKCPKLSTTTLSFIYASLYIVALGVGGYLPAFQALGADQYNTRAQKTRFFTWLFFFTNVGSIFANTLFVYIGNEGKWALAYWLLTIVGGFATLLFVIGTPFLRQYRQPAGNPCTRVFQVVVATLRKWNMKVPSDASILHELSDKELVGRGAVRLKHTSKFRCLEKAAIDNGSVDRKGGRVNPWRLCTLTQVEELKAICRISPFWLCGILFTVVFCQVSTFFVEQAASMDNHVGSFKIPPASIGVVTILVIFLGSSTYDVVIVPIARKVTGNPAGMTPLQRIAVGEFGNLASMTVAAIVEMKRLKIAHAHGLQNAPPFTPVPLSILWLIPQHVFLGFAQVIITPGGMDFFYSESPHSIRGLMGSFATASLALGSYSSSILVSIVVSVTTRGGKPGWIPLNLNQGHLDYFYWLLLILNFLNLILFIFVAHWYKYTNYDNVDELKNNVSELPS